MITATKGYEINVEESRITALDLNGREICGAYQPAGHDYWSLYVTMAVTQITGLSTPPHREHFWGDTGGVIARRWIEMIASLYSLAVQAQESAP